MKEFPVGSVVIFIPPTYAEYVGKEGTIVDGLGVYDTIPFGPKEGYRVLVQGLGDEVMFSMHEGMKLKKFPPEQDAWCREVMNKVLTPLDVKILAEVM